ncbi:hypothetical protein OG585_47040 (plasmid) [Streptomyces sp. NBC_01340]|uniref:hypothetical protein n=1 Tax=Streptomyces sp. NBC_01340 TaxID=2903830 RepID=UPI002E14E75C|nr:hypothetical protein OG585_47040 [Streptomyces sp. NBC_01340]
MTGQDPAAVLPCDFLLTTMTGSGPDDPVVQLAARQVRTAQSHRERSALAEALLSGPHAQQAPQWLLEAAVAADLEAEKETYQLEGGMTLVALALGHPSCPASLQDTTLKRCTLEQLALLGSPRAGEQLAGAIAEELRIRGGATPPMTPQLLEMPTPAQVVLRRGPLHDLVFEAARDTLPAAPDPDEPDADGDTKDWMKRYTGACEAWESMWRQILQRHPERHRELVQWADGTDAKWTVRNELLGSLPWAVEPGLLAELAAADLERFQLEILVAQGCRMRRAGSDEQQILAHFAGKLSALADQEQVCRRVLGPQSATLLSLWCNAPVVWARHATSGTWRHLLNPTQAKDGYQQAHWRAPDAALAGLATMFAETVARALPFWEPAERYSGISPSEVAWVREIVLHLPTVTDDVKAGIRPIVHDARKRLSPHHPAFSPRHDQRRELEEILDRIERVLADPPPSVGADRRTALGAPDKVTVRELAGVAAQALSDYLDRHAGDDSLVEKALLACAASGHRSKDDFEKVLRRHTCPDTVLLPLTEGLRQNLGGAPTWREAWTCLVLARDTQPTLVRALPAWSALRARGDRYGSAHPSVVAAVRDALGADQDAWNRFATCPATNSGPGAWLRLGDLLDAAATGAPWPKPPGSR